MLKFIRIFLIGTVLYHIIVTVMTYGIFHGQYPQLPALLREAIWLVFVIILIILNFKYLKSYLSKRKYPWILFGILLLFGIFISRVQHKSIYDMFVGIKYGFLYLFIFLSASGIGYFLSKSPHAEEKMMQFLKFITTTLIVIVIAGFVRQGLKLIVPDWFLQMGYGRLDDFRFGDKPPLYYLTGLGGTLRWQGIFAGPNNYGYFLIAFLPWILLGWKTGKKKLADLRKDIKRRNESSKHSESFHDVEIVLRQKQTLLNAGVILVWGVAVLATLSRTAWIGGAVVLALMNIKWIKAHKKITIGLGVCVLLGIVGLSVLKGSSTLAHITAKFASLARVINQPLGYGLGSSGPAIHHNGTLLPENYFIQIMLDIGTIGFLLWAWLMFQITKNLKKIVQYFKSSKYTPNQRTIYLLRRGLTIGWVALLVMGLFLHVFEDSMVNYRFFIVWGMLTGYLSELYPRL